jgi:hypothetical protein
MRFSSVRPPQFVANHVLPGAVSSIPFKSQVANLTRLGELQQLSQRGGQHLLMLVLVVGTAERTPHWEIDEYRPRCMGLLHDVPHRADDECGDAARLDPIGDETHGLVAERSVRHEQRQVDVQAPQLFGQGWD